MSDARTAAVELFIDSWNRREVEPVLEITSDDFEYVNPPNAVEPGVRRGPEGIRHVMEAQWEALGEEARVEIDRIHPPGRRSIDRAGECVARDAGERCASREQARARLDF